MTELNLPDTLDMATAAARKALATYWKSPLTSMTTAVRVACFDPAGRRIVAKMDRDGWRDGERILSDDECRQLRTRLAKNHRGEPIVRGSSGPCWMSDRL